MNRRTFLKSSIAVLFGLDAALGVDRMAGLDAAWIRVIEVESHSGKDPQCRIPQAADDLGIAQITPIVVRDCNRILKLPVFSLSDRLDDKASRAMFDTYCKHYYPEGELEEWCRLWHRGPSRKRQYDELGDLYWKKCLSVVV